MRVYNAKEFVRPVCLSRGVNGAIEYNRVKMSTTWRVWDSKESVAMRNVPWGHLTIQTNLATVSRCIRVLVPWCTHQDEIWYYNEDVKLHVAQWSHILHTLRSEHCVLYTISLREDSVAGHKNTLSLDESTYRREKEGGREKKKDRRTS